MENNVLEQLKDIHQPPPISFWPLAPGWYIVIALVIIAALIGLFFFYKRQLRARRRKEILAAVDELYLQYQQDETNAALTQLSVLLRRIVLDRFPRKEIAGLYGEAWLKFLNQHLDKEACAQQLFLQNAGQLLISAPYQATKISDAEETFELVKRWIKSNL